MGRFGAKHHVHPQLWDKSGCTWPGGRGRDSAAALPLPRCTRSCWWYEHVDGAGTSDKGPDPRYLSCLPINKYGHRHKASLGHLVPVDFCGTQSSECFHGFGKCFCISNSLLLFDESFEPALQSKVCHPCGQQAWLKVILQSFQHSASIIMVRA